MEKMKLRCHFSIIFENLWQFWLVIIIMLVQQAENLIRMIRDIGTGGIRGLIDSGGGWVLGRSDASDRCRFVFFIFQMEKNMDNTGGQSGYNREEYSEEI